MPRYEYWAHTDGWQFLVRLDVAGQVTGACGPLYQTSIPAANMHNYDYDAQPIRAAWIQEHATEFHSIPDAPYLTHGRPSQKGIEI